MKIPITLKSVVLLGIINLLLGGCVVADSQNITEAHLMRAEQQGRVTIGNAMLGESQTSVLANTVKYFALKANCSAIKVAGLNKRASLEEHCTYQPLKGELLFGLPLLKVEYFFKDSTLRKIDVELKASSESALIDLVETVSKQFEIQAEKKGYLHRWALAQDALVVVQQGNIKLRVVPLALLEKNSQGPKIQHR